MGTERARVRRPTRQQVRDQLVDAAGEVLAECGFEASVEEITEHAGFSRGAFYSNYSSKEELFLEAFQRRAAQRIDALQGQLEGAADLAQLLERLGTARFGRTRREFAHHMQLYFHCLARPEFRKSLTEAAENRRQALTDAIHRLVPALHEQPEVVATLTTLLSALDDGLAIQTYLRGRPQPLDVDNILTLLQGTTASKTS